MSEHPFGVYFIPWDAHLRERFVSLSRTQIDSILDISDWVKGSLSLSSISTCIYCSANRHLFVACFLSLSKCRKQTQFDPDSHIAQRSYSSIACNGVVYTRWSGVSARIVWVHETYREKGEYHFHEVNYLLKANLCHSLTLDSYDAPSVDTRSLESLPGRI